MRNRITPQEKSVGLATMMNVVQKRCWEMFTFETKQFFLIPNLQANSSCPTFSATLRCTADWHRKELVEIELDPYCVQNVSFLMKTFPATQHRRRGKFWDLTTFLNFKIQSKFVQNISFLIKTFPTTQHRRRGKSQRLERKITLYHKPLPPVQGVSGLQDLLAILCFFAKKRLNRMYRASQKKCTNRTKS